MTTTRTYRCNLCHDPIKEGTGVGLYYRSNGVNFTVPSEAENHVCQQCLDWIEAEQSETRAIAAKRAAVDAS